MTDDDWREQVLEALGHQPPREGPLQTYVNLKADVSFGFFALYLVGLVVGGVAIGVYFGLGALGVPNGPAAIVTWAVVVGEIAALLWWRRRRRARKVRRYFVNYWEGGKEADIRDSKHDLGEDALVRAERWTLSGDERSATVFDLLTGHLVGVDSNGVRIMGTDESGKPKVLREWPR